MELVTCFQELFQQPAMHSRGRTHNDSQTHIYVLAAAQCRLGIPSAVRPSRSQSRSYFTADSQSVNMSWYRVPLWDLRPDIISCRNVAV
jgi:hypothetical protein